MTSFRSYIPKYAMQSVAVRKPAAKADVSPYERRIGVRFGVYDEKPKEMDGGFYTIVNLNETTLLQFLKDVCESGTPSFQVPLKTPPQYALRFDEEKKSKTYFITEENWRRIKNGDSLMLVESPGVMAERLLRELRNVDTRLVALQHLARVCSDPAFQAAFVSRAGHLFFMNLLMTKPIVVDGLSDLLVAFTAVMEYENISWEEVKEEVIHAVAEIVRVGCVTEHHNYAGNKGSSEDNAAAITLRCSLQILEDATLYSSNFSLVERKMKWSDIVKLLAHADDGVKRCSLAVINALYSKCPSPTKDAIVEALKQQMKLLHNMVKATRTGACPELHKELLRLQKNVILPRLRDRTAPPNLTSGMSGPNSGANKMVSDLLNLLPSDERSYLSASDNLSPHPGRKNGNSARYRALGFRNTQQPLYEFSDSPPGFLPLECLTYAARTHTETLKQHVKRHCGGEQSSCPLVQCSKSLVLLLLEMMGCVPPKNEALVLAGAESCKADRETLYPVLFDPDSKLETHFEKLFWVALQLLLRTWKEMKATRADIPKVETIVREQLQIAMFSQESGAQKEASAPAFLKHSAGSDTGFGIVLINSGNGSDSSTPATSNLSAASLDQITQALNRLHYGEIRQMWLEKRENLTNFESRAKPIVEFREMLRSKVMELIRENRVHHIQRGTDFQLLPTRRKLRHWFCKLSSDRRCLEMSLDYDENAKPASLQLFSVPVSEIISVDQSPMDLKLRFKDPSISVRAFSVGFSEEGARCLPNEGSMIWRRGHPEPMGYEGIREGEAYLNFIAPTEDSCCMWVDAIRVLMKQEPFSRLVTAHKDILINMEIRVRTLTLEGISIPNNPPTVPPPPSNYNFASRKELPLPPPKPAMRQMSSRLDT